MALTCSATETLIALGALDRLIGVEEDCPVTGTEDETKIRNDDHPGKLAALNVESVLALRPDLVIARPDVRQALDGRGLRILRSPPFTNLANLPAFVRDVGAAIGEPEKADEVLEQMRATEERLRALTAGHPRPRVYYETTGLGWTRGAHTIVDDMIALAGGANIAGDVKRSTVVEMRLPRAVDAINGGEFRRALIAQALAQETSLLLFGEPVQQLDLLHQFEVMDFARSFARRGGSAGVVVLHDLGLAARFCDRLALLCGGRIVAHGTPDEVLTEDNVRSAYGVEASITRCERTGALQVVPLAPAPPAPSTPRDSRAP